MFRRMRSEQHYTFRARLIRTSIEVVVAYFGIRADITYKASIKFSETSFYTRGIRTIYFPIKVSPSIQDEQLTPLFPFAGGPGFKSRPRERVSRLRFFLAFLGPSSHVRRQMVPLFVPRTFPHTRITIHHSLIVLSP